MGVRIQMAGAGGKSIAELSRLIRDRMKWCNESARDSVAACSIDALKSIRTRCKVAKPSSVKVTVERDNSLVAGVTERKPQKHPCVRYAGSGARYAGKERVRVADASKIKDLKVYRFTGENNAGYLILAGSAASAKKCAKTIAVRRAMRYAGLAKRALGLLMTKTNTQRVADPFDALVESKADDVTSKHEVARKDADGGGTYILVLDDVLRYALDAIKGGRSAVDMSIRRASNKIASVINQKIKRHGEEFFVANKIPTPFPELRRRR